MHTHMYTHTHARTHTHDAGNAFENLTDARRTLREIMLLRHLKHENVIDILDIMRPSSRWGGRSSGEGAAVCIRA